MNEKLFPIQVPLNTGSYLNAIPWAMIAPHEKQALLNHYGQSIQQLAERQQITIAEACGAIGKWVEE